MSDMPRTEMKCERCGSFSSTRICWHCSNLPDAVTYADIERLKAELLSARSALALAAEDDAGRDELIDQGRALLTEMEPYLERLICYASTRTEKIVSKDFVARVMDYLRRSQPRNPAL